MNKNIIIPIVTAVVGLIFGMLVFGDSSPEVASEQKNEGKQVWTCSMHPQIRKDAPGDCPICGMDLIPLDESAGDNPLVFKMSPDAVRIANIQTTIVGGAGDQSLNGITVSGRLTSDETSASSLVSHIPGRIEKLYVSFTGDRVYRGQKIAMIYSPNLISAQGELLEAYKVRESFPELLEAAKNKLRFWKISDNEIDEILNTQKVKEFFDIRAEHTGVIDKRRVNVGDHLMQGGVLFDVQNLNSLWAVFDIYERDLSLINVGNEITFTTPSLKDESFTSKVVFIDPVINPATRTASIRIEVSNSKKLLKPDMFVTGVIKNNSMERNQLYVPKSAVLWTGVRSVVYVKLPGTDMPSFEYREILLGNVFGDQYEVLEGLELGEEVVTNGAFVIDASAQLNNRNSMMNKSLLGAKPIERNFKTPDLSANIPDQFKSQLKVVIDAYLDLKNALVETKFVVAKKHAQKFKSGLDKVDMKLVEGEAHNYWMEKSEKMKTGIMAIIDGENIDIQRGSFDDLSVTLISLSQAFGMHESKLFIQYCPMADNNKGAYWMSTERFIRNPYFGDQMLKCGELKDSIKDVSIK